MMSFSRNDSKEKEKLPKFILPGNRGGAGVRSQYKKFITRNDMIILGPGTTTFNEGEHL